VTRVNTKLSPAIGFSMADIGRGVGVARRVNWSRSLCLSRRQGLSDLVTVHARKANYLGSCLGSPFCLSVNFGEMCLLQSVELEGSTGSTYRKNYRLTTGLIQGIKIQVRIVHINV
jgi:hypothetical protein